MPTTPITPLPPLRSPSLRTEATRSSSPRRRTPRSSCARPHEESRWSHGSMRRSTPWPSRSPTPIVRLRAEPPDFGRDTRTFGYRMRSSSPLRSSSKPTISSPPTGAGNRCDDLASVLASPSSASREAEAEARSSSCINRSYEARRSRPSCTRHQGGTPGSVTWMAAAARRPSTARSTPSGSLPARPPTCHAVIRSRRGVDDDRGPSSRRTHPRPVQASRVDAGAARVTSCRAVRCARRRGRLPTRQRAHHRDLQRRTPLRRREAHPRRRTHEVPRRRPSATDADMAA